MPRPVTAVLVAVLVAASLASCSGSGRTQRATTATSSAGGTPDSPAPAGSVMPGSEPRPAVYRIRYRTRRLAGGRSRVTWEDLAVRRPFVGRRAYFETEPADDTTPTDGTLASFDHLFQFAPEGLRQLSGRQPGPPTGDEALSAVLADAVALGTARLLGDGAVAGTPCRVVRFREPPAGVLKRLTPGGDRDDLCLDARGLLLSERWTFNGALVLVREATEVRAGPGTPLPALDVAAAAPPGIVAPTAGPAPADGRNLDDPPPPVGFTARDPVAFSLDVPDEATGAPHILYSSTVWPFERGADVITVEAGLSTSTRLPWSEGDPGRSVTMPLGSARATVRNDGAELRLDLGARRWVRVRGTMPIAALVEYARTIPPVRQPAR